MLVHKVGEFLAQLVGLGRAGPQHFGSGRVVEERKQEVLHGDELMSLLSGFDKGHVQTDFKLLRDHFSFPP